MYLFVIEHYGVNYRVYAEYFKQACDKLGFYWLDDCWVIKRYKVGNIG